MSTATQTIHGYAAASTIDATADYLLIDPASTGNYLKINRNVLLAITGNPLGHTDTQTVSNKTLGVTNTITSKDSLLTLQNASDLTKQVNFSLAGITTGTTRTITLPNRSDTLVTLGGTETLTAKTLTSPTITGGSIDNTTITVDSISGHTTGTIVTIGGVQMNNGIVATTGAVNTNSILAGAVVPNSLVASSGSGWAWQSFTPTVANMTVGNGTLTARYTQIGKKIKVFFAFKGGTTSAISGDMSFTPPVAASALYTTVAINIVIGGGQIDSGGSPSSVICAPFFNASNASIHIGYVSPSSSANGINNSSGITFTTPASIQIGFWAEYEAA